MLKLGDILLALVLLLRQEVCRGQGLLGSEELITPNGELDGGSRKPARHRHLLLQQDGAVVAAVALGGSSNTTCGGVLVAPDVILTVRGSFCEIEWAQGARIVTGHPHQHRQRQRFLQSSAKDPGMSGLWGVQALYGSSEDDGNPLMLVHLSLPVPEATFVSYKESKSTQPLQMLIADAGDEADQRAVVVACMLKTMKDNDKDNARSIFSTQVPAINSGFCIGDFLGGGWPIVMAASTEDRDQNPSSSQRWQHHLVGLVASWHREEKDERKDLTAANTCVTENIRVAAFADWIRETICCISDFVAPDDDISDCQLLKRQETDEDKCPNAAPLWTTDHGAVQQQQQQQRYRELQSDAAAPISSPVQVNPPQPTRNTAGQTVAPVTTDDTVEPSESPQSATTLIPSLGVAAPVGEPPSSPNVATTPGPARVAMASPIFETTAPAPAADGTPSQTATPKAPPPAIGGSNGTKAPSIVPPVKTPTHLSASPDANGLPNAKPIDDVAAISPITLPISLPVLQPATISVAAKPPPTKPPFLVPLLPSVPVTIPTKKNPTIKPSPSIPNPVASLFPSSPPTSSPSANPTIKPSSNPVAGAPSEPSISPSSFDVTTEPTKGNTTLFGPSFSPTPAVPLSVLPSSTSAPSPSSTPTPDSASPSTVVDGPQPLNVFVLPSKDCAPDLACPWIEKFPGYQLHIVKNDVCIERCQWMERLNVYKLIGWKCGYCPKPNTP